MGGEARCQPALRLQARYIAPCPCSSIGGAMSRPSGGRSGTNVGDDYQPAPAM